MKKNKDIILNKAKEYYINNKKLIKDYQNQYRASKTDEQKQKMKEYQKQYRESKNDEQKQKMKEYQKNIEKVGQMNKNKK